MLNNLQRFFSLGLLLISSLTSHVLFARAADSQLPMNIEASSVVVNEKKGISRYQGQVKITQGSRKIHGDSIVVHSTNSKVDRVVIKGEPATFSQLNDNNEETHASSNEMIFYARKETLVLKDNAQLKQKDNVFKSEYISYNTEKDIISAGDQENNANERVKITLHPQKDKTKDKTP